MACTCCILSRRLLYLCWLCWWQSWSASACPWIYSQCLLDPPDASKNAALHEQDADTLSFCAKFAGVPVQLLLDTGASDKVLALTSCSVCASRHDLFLMLSKALIQAVTRLLSQEVFLLLSRWRVIASRLQTLLLNCLKQFNNNIGRPSNWLSPSLLEELRSFPGLANFSRRLVQGYANLCAPVSTLLRKDQPFAWTSDCETSFQAVKDALAAAPVLDFCLTWMNTLRFKPNLVRCFWL